MGLISEIIALDALTQTAIKLGQRTDQERLLELIKLRKELSQQMGKLSKAADAFDFSGRGDDIAGIFRQKLSHMKSVIAKHQAFWPVSMIETDSREYRRSADNLINVQAAFIAWALKELR